MSGPCPACGRAEEYWADREPGTKQRQRSDYEDRDARYREFHRKLGPGLLAMDVDQVEYRINCWGEPQPVALIELTRIDGAPDPPASYFQAIMERAGTRDAQLTVLRILAELVAVPLFYVAYMQDGSAFYVAEASHERPCWRRYDRPGYRAYLETL